MRTPFKMKSSPAKGKLQDFFNSVGANLKRNKKDIGAEAKKKYKGSKQTTNKAGEKIGYVARSSEERFNTQERRSKNVAKGNTSTKSELQKSRAAETAKTATVANKPKKVVTEEPKSKGNYYAFSGKKGDKFKYRSRTKSSQYEFQRPGSKTWETSKTKAGNKAIHDLFVDDKTSVTSITPVKKKYNKKK